MAGVAMLRYGENSMLPRNSPTSESTGQYFLTYWVFYVLCQIENTVIEDSILSG